MVHHTEWDRKIDQRGGYMQKDHDEMEEIIREMAPGGKHHHAFKDGSVKSDSDILHKGASASVVHRGSDYDHSLPSFYHGKWYQSSDSFMMSALKAFLFIILTFIALKFFMMASKSMGKRSSRSKSRSRSRSR
jgi:hypothetical protein